MHYVFSNITKHREKLLISLIFVITLSLRFINLGYSDYISDEPGSFYYRGYEVNSHLSKWEFLLKQKKGPMQIFVGLIPKTIVGNYNNELAQRIPFALSSTAAIILFYFLVHKLTSSTLAATTSAILLSTNGLIVGYGRIAQYQNLNLLFSFASLYFFLDLRKIDLLPQNYIKKTLLGTMMFCISFLSHWDAVYILIPISVVIIEFLFNKTHLPKTKIILVVANISLVLLVLSPFMIPYISYQLNSPRSMAYLESIVGMGESFRDRPDLGQFELYNPFFTYWFYVVLGSIGLLSIKKNYLSIIWFIAVLGIFRFFMSYSGLHFFNIFIPLVILAGLGIQKIVEISPKILKPLFLVLVSLFLAFFYYQSYLLFVDHTKEYPTESEKILWLKTKKYEHSDNIRHKTGFPLKRYWKEINEFVNEENRKNDEDYGYITNEDRIDEFYMDAEHRNSNGYYAIGIKRPLSLQNDYKFSQIRGKNTVHKIKNASGTTVVRIYRVNPD